MNFKNTKIFGTSVLTVLGVVCLASFMIAAFTWSTQTTASKGPQEVSLSVPSVNEWDAAQFFESNKMYDVILTATYNFHSATQISYYISVQATAGQGTIQSSDFTMDIGGITGVTLVETSPGVWTTGMITVQSSVPSDEITIRIVPTSNALDLGEVSFEISALTSV